MTCEHRGKGAAVEMSEWKGMVRGKALRQDQLHKVVKEKALCDGVRERHRESKRLSQGIGQQKGTKKWDIRSKGEFCGGGC